MYVAFLLHAVRKAAYYLWCVCCDLNGLKDLLFVYGVPVFLDKRCVGWYTSWPKIPLQTCFGERKGWNGLFVQLDGCPWHFKLNSKHHKSCQQHRQDPNPKCTGVLGPDISHPLRVLLRVYFAVKESGCAEVMDGGPGPNITRSRTPRYWQRLRHKAVVRQ